MSGLQEYVRNHCRLAKEFEARVVADDRFRVMNNVKVNHNPIIKTTNSPASQVGLVCFRLFGSNQLNQKLLTTINASGKLHMVRLVNRIVQYSIPTVFPGAGQCQ